MVYFKGKLWKGRALEMLEEKIRELYRITAELEKKYPGRCFTPDGYLVGSIGEVYERLCKTMVKVLFVCHGSSR